MVEYNYSNNQVTQATNVPSPQPQSFIGVPPPPTEVTTFELTPRLPVRQPQAISIEELQELAESYLNLLTCAVLYTNGYQSGGLARESASNQDRSQMIYHMKFDPASQNANVEVDIPTVDAGYATFCKFVGIDVDPTQVNLIVNLNGEIAYETFNKTTNERIQYFRLPLEEPTVPFIEEEPDDPRDIDVPAMAATQPVATTQPPAPRSEPYDELDYSLVEMANQIVRFKAIGMMDVEELMIVAQAYLLTRPTGAFLPVEEASKELKRRYGTGWSPSSIQRHINQNTPFEWIAGLHYLGKSKRASYLNMTAIEQSMLAEEE